MPEEVEVKEQKKAVTKQNVNYRAVELIYGNPLILGIIAVGILGLGGAIIFAFAPAGSSVDKIVIPAITGVSGLATGVALSKLQKGG